MTDSRKPDFDFNELMGKAQEMQKKMQEAQSQIAKTIVVGAAGGDLVKVHKRGNQYATKVEVHESLVPGLSLQDREMLEDLIVAAINDAVDKIEANTKEQISSLAGIELPEGFGGDAQGG